MTQNYWQYQIIVNYGPFTLCLKWSHINIKIWAASCENQQNGMCAQQRLRSAWHLPSLIRVFTVGVKKPWVLSYPLSAQWRLIRLGGCPGWSESSLGAHSFCWFWHVTAQLMLKSLDNVNTGCSVLKSSPVMEMEVIVDNVNGPRVQTHIPYPHEVLFVLG